MSLIEEYASYLSIHILLLGTKSAKIKLTGISEEDINEYKVSFTIKDKDTNYSADDMKGHLNISATSKKDALDIFKEVVKEISL